MSQLENTHTDLCFRKENQFESTFIEIINSRKRILLVVFIPNHPNMNVFVLNKNDLATPCNLASF